MMVYPDGLDRATELAEQSISDLRDQQLPPNPDNFAVWYTYLSGDVPDLIRVIDRLRRSGTPLTPRTCTDLHRRFFGSDAEGRTLRETGERTQRLLAQIIELLSGAGAGNVRYGQALVGIEQELAEPLTVDQLRALITAIATETREIAEQHQQLQARLSETSAELVQVRSHLQLAMREAVTDSLTGLGNRKALERTLADALAHADREGQPLSLLMLDIDLFKQFNDNHGHLVGDHVLKLVARTLTECIKGRDSASRFGGEEFAIVLPQTRLTDALALAEQIRKTVGSRQIINRTRNESFGCVTLSIGAAQYLPGESMLYLIQRADAALYSAKRAGRNRVSAGEQPAPSAGALQPALGGERTGAP